MTWGQRDELRADPGSAPGDRNIDAPRRRRRSVWPSIAVVAAAATFGGVIWYAYQNGRAPTGSGAPPLVKAESGSFKVKPDQPAGQEAPYTDSNLYNRLTPDGQKPQVEILRPPTEAPVPRPQPGQPQAQTHPESYPALPPPVPAAPNDASPTVLAPAPGAIVTLAPRTIPHVVPAVTPHAVLAEAPKAKPADPKAAPAPGPHKAGQPTTIAELERKATQTAPSPTPVAATKPVSPAKPAGAGSYRVQLSSVRSPDAVAPEWNKLKHRFPELGSLTVTSSKAEISGKGTFYRVQAGPLDEAGAKSTCAKMQAQGLGCLVVKP